MGYQNITIECRSCFKEFNKEVHFCTPNGDYIDLITTDLKCPHCGKGYKIIEAELVCEITEKELYGGL